MILSPDAIFAQTITIVVEDISSSVQRQDVIESLLQITNCFNQPIQSMSDFNGHFEPLFRDHHLSKMKSFLKSQYETISKSLIARVCQIYNISVVNMLILINRDMFKN